MERRVDRALWRRAALEQCNRLYARRAEASVRQGLEKRGRSQPFRLAHARQRHVRAIRALFARDAACGEPPAHLCFDRGQPVNAGSDAGPQHPRSAPFRKGARARDGKSNGSTSRGCNSAPAIAAVFSSLTAPTKREVTWSCSGHTQPIRADGARVCALRRSVVLNSARACVTEGSISIATNSLTDAEAPGPAPRRAASAAPCRARPATPVTSPFRSPTTDRANATDPDRQPPRHVPTVLRGPASGPRRLCSDATSTPRSRDPLRHRLRDRLAHFPCYRASRRNASIASWRRSRMRPPRAPRSVSCRGRP